MCWHYFFFVTLKLKNRIDRHRLIHVPVLFIKIAFLLFSSLLVRLYQESYLTKNWHTVCMCLLLFLLLHSSFSWQHTPNLMIYRIVQIIRQKKTKYTENRVFNSGCGSIEIHTQYSIWKEYRVCASFFLFDEIKRMG